LKLSGEKGVIGGSITSSYQYGPIEFSRAFYIDNDEVKGYINFKDLLDNIVDLILPASILFLLKTLIINPQLHILFLYTAAYLL
jgi:hypothetical protein